MTETFSFSYIALDNIPLKTEHNDYQNYKLHQQGKTKGNTPSVPKCKITLGK